MPTVFRLVKAPSLLALLLSLGLTAPLLAEPASLVQNAPSKHPAGKTLLLTPVAGHHFNTKAPNRCGSYTVDKITKREFRCLPTKPGALTLTLAICDEPETFCRLERLNLTVTAQ